MEKRRGIPRFPPTAALLARRTKLARATHAAIRRLRPLGQKKNRIAADLAKIEEARVSSKTTFLNL